MKCDKNKCMCDINFDEDDGYEFILDELKDIRRRVDKIISLMETRKEKDSMIREILNTDYEDEDDKKDDDCKLDMDTIMKAIAIRNMMDPFYKNTTKVPPYPDALYTWF